MCFSKSAAHLDDVRVDRGPCIAQRGQTLTDPFHSMVHDKHRLLAATMSMLLLLLLNAERRIILEADKAHYRRRICSPARFKYLHDQNDRRLPPQSEGAITPTFQGSSRILSPE
jgi:hypothetical protein